MDVQVYKDNQYLGPYTIDILREYYFSGHFSRDDLICYDGKNWMPFYEFHEFFSEVVETPKHLIRGKGNFQSSLILHGSLPDVSEFIHKFFSVHGKLKRNASTLSSITGKVKIGTGAMKLLVTLHKREMNSTLVVIETKMATNEFLEPYAELILVSFAEGMDSIDQKAISKAQWQTTFGILAVIIVVPAVLFLLIYILASLR